jgi:hypothetical protein
MKSVFHKYSPSTSLELKESIANFIRNIRLTEFLRVIVSKTKLVDPCVKGFGGHLKHL